MKNAKKKAGGKKKAKRKTLWQKSVAFGDRVIPRPKLSGQERESTQQASERAHLRIGFRYGYAAAKRDARRTNVKA